MTPDHRDRTPRANPDPDDPVHESETIGEATHHIFLSAAHEWRVTFDAIADAMCVLDPEAHIVRCNEAMTRLVGRPFAEILGHPYGAMLGFPSASGQADDLFDGVRRDRRRCQASLVLGGRWLRVTMDPMLDDDGEFVGAVLLASDAGQHDYAQECLQLARELNEGILSSRPCIEIAQKAVQALSRLIPCLWVGLMPWQGEAAAKDVLASATPTKPEAIKGLAVRPPYSKEVVARLRDGEIVCRPEQSKAPASHADAWFGVPMRDQGELVGVLDLLVANGDQLTDEHAAIARQVANHLAIALRQAPRR